MQPINMIMDLLLSQENQKRLHVQEADIITVKKKAFDVSSTRMHFLQDQFQMTSPVLVDWFILKYSVSQNRYNPLIW